MKSLFEYLKSKGIDVRPVDPLNMEAYLKDVRENVIPEILREQREKAIRAHQARYKILF